MKHIFIINPKAGKKSKETVIRNLISKHFQENEVIIYITTQTNDATRFVKEYMDNKPQEKTRFYACGGDGTLNEVVNGAYLYDNCEVACLPFGSGNDYIKNFGSSKDFLDLDRIKNGKTIDVDVIKYLDKVSINVFNIGFDANVVYHMMKYKKLPLMSGKSSYNMGVLRAMFSKIKYNVELKLDDCILYEGKALLCAIASGKVYGGGFTCAPLAIVNDGILDVCLVTGVSRLKFIGLIKYYKKGTFLNVEKARKVIRYGQGSCVKIKFDRCVNYASDGELGRDTVFELSIMKKAIKFVLPSDKNL